VELSSRVEYALLALLELASHNGNGKPLKVGEIAASQGIPDRYLDQILTTLRRTGLVQSQRGAKGGYFLAKEPWQITLLEIVSDLEGSSNSKEAKPSEPPTVEKVLLYEVWQEGEKASHAVLSRYTLQDLCQQRDAYRQENPMYYI
jgi:Rrf2 family protein